MYHFFNQNIWPIAMNPSDAEHTLWSASRWWRLDKAPRLSIRIVIWILPSDTVFVNSIKISANAETAMLSILHGFASFCNVHLMQEHAVWQFDEVYRRPPDAPFSRAMWFGFQSRWLVLVATTMNAFSIIPPKIRANIVILGGRGCRFGVQG